MAQLIHPSLIPQSPINRAEELMAIEQIAKEYKSLIFCMQSSNMSFKIGIKDQVEAKVLTSQLKASGWSMVDLIFGRMSKTWFITINLNTTSMEY